MLLYEKNKGEEMRPRFKMTAREFINILELIKSSPHYKDLDRLINAYRVQYKIYDECPTCGHVQKLKGGKK